MTPYMRPKEAPSVKRGMTTPDGMGMVMDSSMSSSSMAQKTARATLVWQYHACSRHAILPLVTSVWQRLQSCSWPARVCSGEGMKRSARI